MKKEGDKKTPKGKFKFIMLLYRKDRNHNFHCKIKKKVIRKNMGWCDDPDSVYYNKLINFPFKYSAEKLYLKKNIYDLILVLDFNMKPIRKGAGSAVFFHLSDKNFRKTKGCVATRKKDFLKILSKVSNKTRLIIN
tara:strand:+ start:231 stop:638 length:408 start_codon:yes stop_codon:yes gene_type:complete